MEVIFNNLIESYINNKVGISYNFLSKTLTRNLRANLITHHLKHELLSAGIGQNKNLDFNQLFRSDKIYWLDRKHNDKFENKFFDIIDKFIKHLNDTCYTGIKSCEFHYTIYPIGSFYKTHLDQFVDTDSRQYSMIIYLNEDWNDKDGGELCIYIDDNFLKIAPKGGISVFFKSSELEHEVLKTNKPRMSITGWLKN